MENFEKCSGEEDRDRPLEAPPAPQAFAASRPLRRLRNGATNRRVTQAAELCPEEIRRADGHPRFDVDSTSRSSDFNKASSMNLPTRTRPRSECLLLWCVTIRSVSSVAGTVGGAAARVGVTAGGNWLKKRFRPDSSWPAMKGLADELAAQLLVKERRGLEQLRGGPAHALTVGLTRDDSVRRSHGAWGGGAIPQWPVDAPNGERRLILLGDAGAGKTVAALRFAVDLLTRRLAVASTSSQAQAPVPVRLNASRWDGDLAFTEWFAEVLRRDFRIPIKLGRKLIDLELVFPILDALDEMDPPGRPPVRAISALDRLNEAPWRSRCVVVLSRTELFEEVIDGRGDGGLYDAQRVVVAPLTSAEVCTYMRAHLDRLGKARGPWARIMSLLEVEPDGVLARACQSPWLLSLVTSAMETGLDTTVDALFHCATVDNVATTLFQAAVPAAVESMPRDRRDRRFDTGDVLVWLRTLALYFDNQRAASIGGNDISQDRVWMIHSPKRVRAGHVAVNLIFGLLCWAAIAAMLITTRPHSGGPFYTRNGAIAGFLAFFLFMIVVVAWTYGWSKDYEAVGRSPRLQLPMAWPSILWRVGWATCLMGVVITICAWVLSYANHSDHAWPHALRLGLLCAAGYLPLSVIVIFVAPMYRPRSRVMVDERHIVRDNILLGLLAGVLFIASEVVGFLTVTALTGAPSSGSPLAVQLIWALPMITFVLVGAFIVTAPAVIRFALASLHFRRTGLFSSRPAKFLAWANTANLLRVTGVRYQFRHETFQQWLCIPPASETPAHTEAVTAAALIPPD